jgi:hypothetical protein
MLHAGRDPSTRAEGRHTLAYATQCGSVGVGASIEPERRADVAARFTVVSPHEDGTWGRPGHVSSHLTPCRTSEQEVCHGRGRALHRMGRARHWA